MRRPLLLLSLLASVATLMGCVTDTPNIYSVDLDGDGEPDPIPAGRGGPWFDCDSALAGGGQAGDVCAFEPRCAETTDETTGTWVSASCVAHRLVLTTQSRGAFVEDCDAPIEVSGSCVSLPLWRFELVAGRCEDHPGRYVTLCTAYTASPPHDGVPSGPWRVDDDASCDVLLQGFAENGDPCEGEHVCGPRGGTPWWQRVAWCDGGALRIVEIVPTSELFL